jgi:hypothetical protein
MKSFGVRGIALEILLVGLFLAACSEDAGPGDNGSPSNVVFPADPDSVSYGRHVQPLFDQTCALVGCHDNGQNPDLRVRLTSHNNVVYSPRLVVIPNNADQSPLVQRIQGTVGVRMPLNRNSLNQNQIDGIRGWIDRGARNN